MNGRAVQALDGLAGILERGYSPRQVAYGTGASIWQVYRWMLGKAQPQARYILKLEGLAIAVTREIVMMKCPLCGEPIGVTPTQGRAGAGYTAFCPPATGCGMRIFITGEAGKDKLLKQVWSVKNGEKDS